MNANDAAKKTEESLLGEWIASMRRPGVGAVVALTVVGGVLRFLRLPHPPLLFDEAATYTRVVGSFRELLAILRYDGFAPLHYELYWLLARVTSLSPVMMRLVPALAGTLMIPAIFFLARQVASRRIATVAAALTCFSAYQLVYSRDAKMYMELWLAATVFIGAMLWWLRSGIRIAWLVFVLAGTTMNGLHALGLCIVGVALIVALTHPLLTRKKFPLLLGGLFLATAPLAAHYVFFNQWSRDISQTGLRRVDLDWIGQRNQRFSKPVLLWDTVASWMLAYRAPRPPITPPTRVIVPVAIVSGVVLALLVLGAFPWKPHLRDDDPQDAPAGRGMLWMILWIGLPSLGFYIMSFIAHHDLWNARYLAIIWPAGVVLTAMLIQRLPTPWLRAGAIVLLIGANVIQYGLRLTVESGVPVNAIAADLDRAVNSDGSLKTIVAVENDADATSLGGNGGIFDFPGSYYMALTTPKRHSPAALRDAPARELFDIPTDVRNVPASVTRLVVWTDGPPTRESADPILKALGKTWSRRAAEQHTVRDFWCWRGMFRCTRSVYVRGDSRQKTPG